MDQNQSKLIRTAAKSLGQNGLRPAPLFILSTSECEEACGSPSHFQSRGEEQERGLSVWHAHQCLFCKPLPPLPLPLPLQPHCPAV